MRELTNEELSFLMEISAQNYESDFQLWVEHMEAAYA